MDELETAKTHEPLLQIRLGFVAPASEKTKNHLKHIRWQDPLLVEDEEAQGNWKVLMGASPLHDHLGALIFFVYFFFVCATWCGLTKNGVGRSSSARYLS